MRVRHADPEGDGDGDGAACVAVCAPYVDGSACAGIALTNEASIVLQRALGFEEVGTYRDIGWKAGAWRDVSSWQPQLASDGGGEAPPPEPLGPQRL